MYLSKAEYKFEWLEPWVKAKYALKTLNGGNLTEKEIESFKYFQNHDEKRVLKVN